jgi:alpha-beta hydrolase superfamily lysophospholipase
LNNLELFAKHTTQKLDRFDRVKLSSPLIDPLQQLFDILPALAIPALALGFA